MRDIMDDLNTSVPPLSSFSGTFVNEQTSDQSPMYCRGKMGPGGGGQGDGGGGGAYTHPHR